jgi:hypothetical protein
MEGNLMSDALEDVLRLVAEGRLTPEEAAPLVAALSGGRATDSGSPGSGAGTTYPEASPPRIRVQVRENGRAVVDVRAPGVLAELATAIPGIPRPYADRVREALRAGIRGSIVDVRDEDGSGISITID